MVSEEISAVLREISPGDSDVKEYADDLILCIQCRQSIRWTCAIAVYGQWLKVRSQHLAKPCMRNDIASGHGSKILIVAGVRFIQPRTRALNVF
jgi:hypothetical protein